MACDHPFLAVVRKITFLLENLKGEPLNAMAARKKDRVRQKKRSSICLIKNISQSLLVTEMSNFLSNATMLFG